MLAVYQISLIIVRQKDILRRDVLDRWKNLKAVKRNFIARYFFCIPLIEHTRIKEIIKFIHQIPIV